MQDQSHEPLWEVIGGCLVFSLAVGFAAGIVNAAVYSALCLLGWFDVTFADVWPAAVNGALNAVGVILMFGVWAWRQR